jgi:hypothetical protein
LPVIIVSAADAKYWDLLYDLILSVRAGEGARGFGFGVLDVGLLPEQRRRLDELGVTVAEPGWDFAVPWREKLPDHARSLHARPFLPRYFPGYEIYLWIDADAWVQDDRVLAYFIDAARGGKLAIVPETDRGYWTLYKPPKLWGQNQKAFAFAYGRRAGYRLGRNPILNGGVWALSARAPHWAAWQEAMRLAFRRRRLATPPASDMSLQMLEQTAQNYVVFHDKLPATFLPAYCNWFCGKGDPLLDERTGLLVEPHAPHETIGIVHLAGKGMKERVFALKTLGGGVRSTLLTYSALRALRSADEAA